MNKRAIAAIFLLAGIAIGLAVGMIQPPDATAQTYDGHFHVIMDAKGKSAIMWNDVTGQTLYSSKNTWGINGPWSHWQEATASR